MERRRLAPTHHIRGSSLQEQTYQCDSMAFGYPEAFSTWNLGQWLRQQSESI
ncbi:hypothetical protein RSAG8_04033, partial [Rhizoctonia solani AG-8 WAC10335]